MFFCSLFPLQALMYLATSMAGSSEAALAAALRQLTAAGANLDYVEPSGYPCNITPLLAALNLVSAMPAIAMPAVRALVAAGASVMKVCQIF